MALEPWNASVSKDTIQVQSQPTMLREDYCVGIICHRSFAVLLLTSCKRLWSWFCFISLAYFLPARRYASVGNRHSNVSVRPSVTRRYCVKTKKAIGMISSPSGSPKTLVFWRQISSPNSKGFPPNGGLKQGSVRKIQRFSSFKRQYLENGSRYGQSYY